MRFTRVAAAATSLLLFGASTTIGSAGAASTGVGTSKNSTTILDVSVGEEGALLGLRLLGDDSQSTIDTKTAAAPEAFSKLTALSASSTVLELDGEPLDLEVGVLESRQPGGDADVNNTPISLSVPGVPVPTGFSNVLTGTLSLAHLTSAVDTAGARSSLDASLSSLSAVGGLLNVDLVASKSGTDSAAGAASSTRTAAVDAVTVLDLGAVLDGLGIPLSDLTVAQVDDLLAALDAAVEGLAVDATLQETIDAVQAQIAVLEAAVLGGTGLVDGTAGTIVDTAGLGDIIPDTDLTGLTGTAVEQANALIDLLQAGLGEVLANGLSALDDAPLLALEGVDVGVTTKAADTLGNSAADVTGEIGAINVGGITIPGIDLLDTAEVVTDTLADIHAALDGVLSTISAEVGVDLVSLAEMVNVELLNITESVTAVNGYNVAQAGITAVSASITPPAELQAIVDAVAAAAGAGDTITDAIEALNVDLPVLNSAMSDLENTLGGSLQALADGADVNLVQVLGTSEFKVNAAPVTPGTGGSLPATGSNALRIAALGFLLVALGLGMGAWFRMPVPAWVRTVR